MIAKFQTLQTAWQVQTSHTPLERTQRQTLKIAWQCHEFQALIEFSTDHRKSSVEDFLAVHPSQVLVEVNTKRQRPEIAG